MDVLSKDQRHKNMAAIHSANTKPEMIVRKYLFTHGFRYRLNHPRLPGRPDIVLRKYRTCIFINGCFWHGHEGCKYYVIPKTNTEFWANKINRNIARDKKVQKELAKMGWHCITIWECELKPQKREQTLVSLEYTLNHIFKRPHCQLLYKRRRGNIKSCRRYNLLLHSRPLKINSSTRPSHNFKAGSGIPLPPTFVKTKKQKNAQQTEHS